MKNIPLFKVFSNKIPALKKLDQVLSSGFINEGQEVNELTEKLKKKLGHNNVVLMNSCTSALTVAYKLAGVKKGKNVVSTPMTCIATNTPIINLEGSIKWTDINPKSGMPDYDHVISKVDKNTVAICLVSWAGVPPVDLEKIYKFCKKNNVKLIHDSAHAFMTELKKKSISQFADYSCFSFQAIKHFTCGDGGALICKNKNDYEKAKKLKWFGYDREKAKDEKGNWKSQQDADITYDDLGYKFNMNNIAAAVGLANFSEIDSIISKHRRAAKIYDSFFLKNNIIRPIIKPKNSNPSYWVYTLVILDEKISRDDLVKELNNNNIFAGQVHVPCDEYSCFKKFKTKLPGLRKFQKNQFSIPCGWWVSEKEAIMISKKVLELIS